MSIAPAPNDDKSSCSGNLDPPRRDPAHLAATLPGASGTRPMDRPGPARRWPLVERHRQRSRKTLLAGLIWESETPCTGCDVRCRPFATTTPAARHSHCFSSSHAGIMVTASSLRAMRWLARATNAPMIWQVLSSRRDMFMSSVFPRRVMARPSIGVARIGACHRVLGAVPRCR